MCDFRDLKEVWGVDSKRGPLVSQMEKRRKFARLRRVVEEASEKDSKKSRVSIG